MRPVRLPGHLQRAHLAGQGADGQVRAAGAFQDRAGDEARARQVHDGRGHVSWLADPAGRAGRRYRLEEPGPRAGRRALRQLASASVHDEHVAGVLAEFTAQRRAALRALLEQGVASGDIAPTADLAMLTDLAYGVLWYRLLVGHAPLDAEAARDLAVHLIAAGQAAAEVPGAAGGPA